MEGKSEENLNSLLAMSGPNRVGLNETLRIYVPLCWVEYRLRWTIWFLLLMFSIRNIWKQPARSCTMITALKRIHQKNAFTATGLFLPQPVYYAVCQFLQYSAMTITKAISNLTYQIVLFYNNLVATCRNQDKTVQFLMWNIWKL